MMERLFHSRLHALNDSCTNHSISRSRYFDNCNPSFKKFKVEQAPTSYVARFPTLDMNVEELQWISPLVEFVNDLLSSSKSLYRAHDTKKNNYVDGKAPDISICSFLEEPNPTNVSTFIEVKKKSFTNGDRGQVLAYMDSFMISQSDRHSFVCILMNNFEFQILQICRDYYHLTFSYYISDVIQFDQGRNNLKRFIIQSPVFFGFYNSITYNNVSINVKQVGSGASSNVYYDDQSGFVYKSFKNKLDFDNEKAVMNLIKQNSLVKCLPIIESADDSSLTIKFGPKGDHLRSIPTSSNLCELIDAIKDLHSINRVHRDVRPSNVMISNNVLRIFDLAFSIEPDISRVYEGTVRYASTDVLMHLQQKTKEFKYLFKHDLESLSKCVFILIYQKLESRLNQIHSNDYSSIIDFWDVHMLSVPFWKELISYSNDSEQYFQYLMKLKEFLPQ